MRWERDTEYQKLGNGRLIDMISDVSGCVERVAERLTESEIAPMNPGGNCESILLRIDSPQFYRVVNIRTSTASSKSWFDPCARSTRICAQESSSVRPRLVVCLCRIQRETVYMALMFRPRRPGGRYTLQAAQPVCSTERMRPMASAEICITGPGRYDEGGTLRGVIPTTGRSVCFRESQFARCLFRSGNRARYRHWPSRG